MSVCSSISAGIVLNCTTPLVPGVDTDILLANKADIAGYTVDAANPMLVTGITMKTGKQFWKFEGQNNSVEPKSSLSVGKYSRFYEHDAAFKIFTNTVDAKLQVDRLCKGKLVALVKGNDGNWEIYGKDCGLVASEMTRDPNSTDDGGAYNLTLKSPDTTKEPYLPATFYATSAVATETSIADLLQPA